MFRLEIFVQKKHLADVFERLTNIADVHSCAVVPNLETKPNGQLHVRADSAAELLTKELHKRNLTEIKGPDFRALVADLKLNPVSANHYISTLVDAGVLKRGRKIKNYVLYSVTGK